MKRILAPVFLGTISIFQAFAGQMPTPESETPAKASVPVLPAAIDAASVVANLAVLAVAPVDALLQTPLVLRSAEHSVRPSDLALVLIGDGSTTSVRMLTNVFTARGTMIPAADTFLVTAGASDPVTDLDPNESYLDLLAVNRISPTSFSVTGGGAIGSDSLTRSQTAMVAGGGVAVLWAGLAFMKLARLKRERNARKGTRVKRREPAPLQ